MLAHIPYQTIRSSNARLSSTVCALALFASAAFGGTANATTNERMELWLGKLPMSAAVTTPSSAGGVSPASRPAPIKPDADAVARLKWWSVGGPAHRWNEIILEEMQEAFIVLPMAARHLALFHAALDDAVVHARKHRMAPASATAPAKPATASEHAAVAEAAAAILADLFPARTAAIAKKVEEAVTTRVLAGADTTDAIAAGQKIGQLVAAVAISRAKADGSDAKWTGSVPEGAGLWKGANPIAPLAGTWRPWVLSSSSELRPSAPPRFDSDEVKAALAELKSFVRTPKTNHRATYWEVHGGARAHTLWNEIARMKLLESGTAVEEGARVLAALNIALADAGTACWDAKYAYWYIRPPQLEAELKSLFPAPNHPSFPAAHGCFSTAAATVLAGIFTRDRERLLALAREAAEARVWAGIHYRFDIEAGQEIGRKVGEKVLGRALPSRMN